MDARLVETGAGKLSRLDEKLVETHDGCICCTLREDLVLEVAKLAKEGRFDYLLVESTGISEPLPVAEMFTFEGDDGRNLSDVARLDTMVTVVDATRFLRDWYSEDDLRARRNALSEDDEGTVPDLLVQQVEFGDVLVRSKLDLVAPAEVPRLESMLRSLNRDARIVRSERGKLPLAEILNTGRFDFERAAQAPGWLKEMRGEHAPETETYGITSFVYRSRRPFHPGCFSAFLDTDPTGVGVLRSKRVFWLATRFDVIGLWSHACGAASCEAAGIWYAALSKDEWPDDVESHAAIRARLRRALR